MVLLMYALDGTSRSLLHNIPGYLSFILTIDQYQQSSAFCSSSGRFQALPQTSCSQLMQCAWWEDTASMLLYTNLQALWSTLSPPQACCTQCINRLQCLDGLQRLFPFYNCNRNLHEPFCCHYSAKVCMLHCRIADSELEQDPAANLLTSASEEAQKVARNEGKVRSQLICSESCLMCHACAT